VQEMNAIFGDNACTELMVRPIGAVRLEV